MSLYLKHRPKSLETVLGNSELIETLEGFLSDVEKCPHVFLLHGPTGCGKTTIARIIADRLGAAGDFKEMNSSQFNGIDTIRKIQQEMVYKPLEGSCKVYLMDEVHQMTSQAQEAALKMLEDTPKHVYFILCTTNPNKLIKAIHGRCSKLQVSLLNETETITLLRRILKKEKQTVEPQVLEYIAKNTNGHARNAIQRLEQVLQVEESKRLAIAKQVEQETNQAINLCRAIIKKEGWKSIRIILSNLKEANVDAEEIRRVMLGYCQSILLGDKPNDMAAAIIEQFWEPTYNIGFPGIVYNCYSLINK